MGVIFPPLGRGGIFGIAFVERNAGRIRKTWAGGWELVACPSLRFGKRLDPAEKIENLLRVASKKVARTLAASHVRQLCVMSGSGHRTQRLQGRPVSQPPGKDAFRYGARGGRWRARAGPSDANT